MSADLSQAVCRQPGCGGPASGVCINQIPFDECPDVISAEDLEGTADVPVDAGPETVSTGRTGVMSVEEADAFLRTYGGTVLAVVAGPDAGKTTLASALYDLLRRGKLNGYGFAGSETIRGLEERCFDSRVASGQDSPITLRTPRSSPLIFLHLRIAVPDGRQVDLLLSDRSGEHFDAALNAPAQFADFVEIGRSDAILLLVDGAKLVNGHQAEIARLRKLVIALAQAGSLSKKNIHLIVTKADLLQGEAQHQLVQQRATLIVEEIKKRADDATVEIYLTACRARKGQSTFGDGLDRLLELNVPPVIERPFWTRPWTSGTGGNPLDRLTHVARWQ